MSDEHFVFFNQLASPDMSVSRLEEVLGGDDEQIEIDLVAVPAEISRIVVVLYVNDGVARRRALGQLKECRVRVLNLADNKELVRSENLAPLLTNETAESAMGRDDLPFLRRRAHPGRTARPPTKASRAIADFLASRGARPGRPTRALSPRPFTPMQTEVASSPSRSVPASSPLDLADPVSLTTARPSRPRVVRIRIGVPTILTPNAPTVTLTRLQTGIGSLNVVAACPDSVCDLRIGCAFQLRSGQTSTL